MKATIGRGNFLLNGWWKYITDWNGTCFKSGVVQNTRNPALFESKAIQNCSAWSYWNQLTVSLVAGLANWSLSIWHHVAGDFKKKKEKRNLKCQRETSWVWSGRYRFDFANLQNYADETALLQELSRLKVPENTFKYFPSSQVFLNWEEWRLPRVNHRHARLLRRWEPDNGMYYYGDRSSSQSIKGPQTLRGV